MEVNQCGSLGCLGARMSSVPLWYRVDDPYGLMLVWETALKAYFREQGRDENSLSISFHYPGKVRQQVMERMGAQG